MRRRPGSQRYTTRACRTSPFAASRTRVVAASIERRRVPSSPSRWHPHSSAKSASPTASTLQRAHWNTAGLESGVASSAEHMPVTEYQLTSLRNSPSNSVLLLLVTRTPRGCKPALRHSASIVGLSAPPTGAPPTPATGPNTDRRRRHGASRVRSPARFRRSTRTATHWMANARRFRPTLAPSLPRDTLRHRHRRRSTGVLLARTRRTPPPIPSRSTTTQRTGFRNSRRPTSRYVPTP